MSTDVSPLGKAQALFATEGLPFPHIPAEMHDTFCLLAPWVYSTRTDIPDPYGIAQFVEEVSTQPVADYVVLGHTGHGINSYAMHYYLVRGSLALFLQIAWGGAYTDNDKAVEKMATAYAQAEQLAAAIEAAKLSPSERLIVVISDFYGSRWTHLDGTKDPKVFRTDVDWQTDRNVLQKVLSTYAKAQEADE
ncbi:MAG: hypothetical protein VKK04_02655 [Synechococcales bacterium]|nr:hypothetical protein [Synechococcales bacterium]